MAEKCKACGGTKRHHGGLTEWCPICHGTGVEPVALVEREVLEICQAQEYCTVCIRLAAVVEAGEELAYLVEHPFSQGTATQGEWRERKEKALKKWREARNATK